MSRFALVTLLALALTAAPAAAEPKQVKPDRAAINALLDVFVPAVVAQKDLKRGWSLVAGVARTTSYDQWIKGNSSVQRYPAKGASFHGWTVNYSYPGDIGFDILLQSTNRKQGAWAFRAEAQKIGGRWRITTWYPVATFAPPGQVQTVVGPNDLGPSNSAAAASTSRGRLSPWVLLLPVALVGGLGLGGVAFAGARWTRSRRRVRSIERSISRS